MDHINTDLDLADPATPAEELPYDEAITFLKDRVSMTKAEWEDLEPKLRFRAFTLANVERYDAIEKVRLKLIDGIEQDAVIADLWPELQQYGSTPFYWETVIRTNFETCYNAGRKQQIDKDKPDALEIIVIDDERTSPICQALRGLVLPYNHPFWKSNWPPFHFNCRTSIRAIYKAQKEDYDRMTNPTLKKLQKQFVPQEGFGGNPTDNGNYWMMLPDMFTRGLKTGAIHEFNFMDNVIADYNKVWEGYTRKKYMGGGWVDVNTSITNREEYPENRAVADLLARKNGYHIKMLPAHQRKDWKNPDYLINGELWELESPRAATKSAIDRAIRAGQAQASRLILHVPDDMDKEILRSTIKNRFTRQDSPARIEKLIIIQKGRMSRYTASEIRAWK